MMGVTLPFRSSGYAKKSLKNDGRHIAACGVYAWKVRASSLIAIPFLVLVAGRALWSAVRPMPEGLDARDAFQTNA